MEYPAMKFEELEIGDTFMLFPSSNLLYEKTSDTEAKCIEADFGIILSEEYTVIIVANT